MKATDKQIKYLSYLIKTLEIKLKKEYAYYNKENKTIVQIAESFKTSIDCKPDEITKFEASKAISILKEALNN